MRTLVSLILSGISFISLAQEDQNFPPPDQAPVVTAQKVNGTIKVDGKLTETDSGLETLKIPYPGL